MPDTRIDEIAPQVFRIATDIPTPDGAGFSFNQYLIAADEPLVWHTGPRALYEATRTAIARVLDPATLRWIGFSHFEADECGALNHFLVAAPNAQPLCGRIGALVSATDFADKPPRALKDGETLDTGGARLTWMDTPHLPHGWDCGLIFDETRKLLFCGDLFTQGGNDHAPIVETDILGPSEAFRGPLDYFAHAPDTGAQLERLAALNPETLACMHGPAWRGDGAGLLRELAGRVA
ncbi:MAG: MBL fold metallo-hydrolase [Caulobacteraceae bacterium]